MSKVAYTKTLVTFEDGSSPDRASSGILITGHSPWARGKDMR